MKDIKERR